MYRLATDGEKVNTDTEHSAPYNRL